MNIQSSEFLGLGLGVITAFLGAYYLILRIRDMHEEKPDPKLTYVTYAHMDKVRLELMRIIAESEQDLRVLRAEIREDTRVMQRGYTQSLMETRDLISKNAQNISSLIAQAKLANQRISELNLKVDKLAASGK